MECVSNIKFAAGQLGSAGRGRGYLHHGPILVQFLSMSVMILLLDASSKHKSRLCPQDIRNIVHEIIHRKNQINDAIKLLESELLASSFVVR